jgi:hypothetical protein
MRAIQEPQELSQRRHEIPQLVGGTLSSKVAFLEYDLFIRAALWAEKLGKGGEYLVATKTRRKN